MERLLPHRELHPQHLSQVGGPNDLNPTEGSPPAAAFKKNSGGPEGSVSAEIYFLRHHEALLAENACTGRHTLHQLLVSLFCH